jgi:hypothetical protein
MARDCLFCATRFDHDESGFLKYALHSLSNQGIVSDDKYTSPFSPLDGQAT